MKSFLSGLVFLVFCAVLPAGGAAAHPAGAAADPAARALARAMEAVAEEDWDKAAALVSPAGAIGRDIIAWHRLRAGFGDFADYISFLERRPDWPGLPLLRARGEANIPADADPDRVIAYFAPQAPRTGTGALRLAAALRASGQGSRAAAAIVAAWRNLSLTRPEEETMLADYGPALVNHHRARQDMLLWRGLTDQAERLNALVGTGYARLARARIALIRNKSSGLGKLIREVPGSLADDPGLAHARFVWRLKKKLTNGALELLEQRSTSARSLGRPAAWASERRRLARQLMRDGKPRAAYRIASRHFLKQGSDFNDLEWLSGFIALSDLKDPELALRHFRRFRAGVATPISLGRAGYWEGRALEALGDREGARLAYEFGAEFQTSFYGQLAAEKAGIAMSHALTGRETYPDFTRTENAGSSVLQAALLFHRAGYPLLFTRFTRQLAEILTPLEQGALAQMALDLDEPYTAVYLSKYAARSGDVLMRPYFPIPDIVPAQSTVPPELTLAIARRESEFYAGSTSPVGARGLMQLMPRTGKAMARRLNISFELDRLTTDPAYNATLGSAYLGKLMEDFDGYLPFVAVGYNAGPSRVRRWQKQFGDPRRSPEVAVDWIEHIPFDETRNYVMRVLESLAVYRARLSGKTQRWRLSRDLTGR